MFRNHLRRTGVPFAVLAVLFLAGCTQVERVVDRAVSGLASPAVEDQAPEQSLEQRYRQAKALQEAGREAEALDEFRVLADAGHGDSAFELGWAYETGSGVPQDLAAAARWYNLSAAHGSARAQYLAGLAHAEGADGPRDPEKAAGFFARAAVQGYAPAQYRLGRAFANGEGAPMDRLWAGRWYGKAARQGEADAQFAYGVMLAHGQDVPQDLALAHAMLTAAAGNGVSAAGPVLDAIGPRMSGADRDRAQVYLRDIEATSGRGPSDRFADPPTVRYLQAALRRLGVDAGPVDGLDGPKTRQGIRTFQRGEGLPVTGRLDAELLEAVLDRARAVDEAR